MKIHDSTAVRYCSIKTALGEADLHGGGAGTTDGHRCTRMKIHNSSAVGYRSIKTALGEAHLGGGRGGGGARRGGCCGGGLGRFWERWPSRDRGGGGG